MLRVPVQNIRPGMILARPIPVLSESRRFLLQRDVEIPLSLIPRLQALGVREVWVRCRDLEFLEEVIDEELGERQREVYGHVRRNFENVMGEAALNMDFSQFQSSISGLFDFLKQSRCGNMLLQKLDAFDNYLMSHSTNVCYLAMLVGLKLERYLIAERHFKTAREAKDVQVLGLGCLLHDVGKLRLPAEILNKPSRLTAEEMELVQQHPTLGHQMVRGQVPAAAAQVVLNHHQRYDGTGYPRRTCAGSGDPLEPLAGKQIPIFCRIATIADIYDAATSKRCYSEAKPSVQVLHELATHCRGFFDPVVEQAFRQIIPPFPLGQVVQLSNGIEAVVVDFNPHSPHQPKVQGLRDPHGNRFDDPSLEEIDLALHCDVRIVAADGIDVRPYMPAVDAPLLAIG